MIYLIKSLRYLLDNDSSIILTYFFGVTESKQLPPLNYSKNFRTREPVISLR